MSLVIHRRAKESFVLIDTNDPESFALVTITEISRGQVKVAIDAPANVHILRREILNRYAVHKDVLAAVEKLEEGNGTGRF